MALLRRLVLVASALPLSVLAVSLVTPTADACHDYVHGCATACATKVNAPLLCHDSSTVTLEKEGVVATATMQFDSYATTAGILVEAGVKGSITVTFTRTGDSNMTVNLTTAFNATTAVVWDTPMSQAAALDIGQPTTQKVFGFRLPADAASGIKALEFSVLARKAALSETKWGLLAFQATAKKTGPLGLPIPWTGFAGGAVAVVAGAWLFTALRRTHGGKAPKALPACTSFHFPLGQPVAERVYWHP